MKEDSFQLVHRELPRKDRTGQKPPLLLMLHGFGSHENDLFSMAPMLHNKCVVVSLRAPLSLPWGGFAWYEIDFDQVGKGKMNNLGQAEESLQLILADLPKIHEKYQTDPAQTWLMGFSQGSILCYALSLRHPDKFSYVMALSGYILNELVPVQHNPDQLKHLDFFVSHGEQDEILPVAWARTSVKMLEQLGISHQYQEYPMGHGVNPQCFDDLQQWMKTRKLL